VHSRVRRASPVCLGRVGEVELVKLALLVSVRHLEAHHVRTGLWTWLDIDYEQSLMHRMACGADFVSTGP